MKGSSTGNLIGAIGEVLKGNLYLSSRVSNHILKSLSGNRSTGLVGVERLTDRELEVFDLMVAEKPTYKSPSNCTSAGEPWMRTGVI